MVKTKRDTWNRKLQFPFAHSASLNMLSGPPHFDSGQGRSAHGADTEVVELSGLSREVADYISEAVATGELSGGHGHKLSPARHLAQPATRMMLVCQRLKLMSLSAQAGRDKF